MTAYGIVSGVMIPINSPSGERYIMRFDGDTQRPCQSVMNELGMIGLHAYDVYDCLKRSEMAPTRTLTRRELEVIRWTAQGKTSAEIGQILSLSDHTVNAYMNNAIKKLDCVNRTQLVAKAIRSKLIN
ncbi:Regulatory protein SdiA [compost metagenome]